MSEDIDALLEQRGKIYGDANVQYERVAEVWSGIIGHPVTAYQAMLCMVGLKLVRAEMNPEHTDSLTDAKGYVVLAEKNVEPAKASAPFDSNVFHGVVPNTGGFAHIGHDPDPGCRERIVDGKVRGDCVTDLGYSKFCPVCLGLRSKHVGDGLCPR